MSMTMETAYFVPITKQLMCGVFVEIEVAD